MAESLTLQLTLGAGEHVIRVEVVGDLRLQPITVARGAVRTGVFLRPQTTRQWDDAQTLRGAYPVQLLSLEAALREYERCYDPLMIAGHVVTAAGEIPLAEVPFVTAWYEQFFTSQDEIRERYGPAARVPWAADRLLSRLGVTAPGPVDVDDLAALLAAL